MNMFRPFFLNNNGIRCSSRLSLVRRHLEESSPCTWGASRKKSTMMIWRCPQAHQHTRRLSGRPVGTRQGATLVCGGPNGPPPPKRRTSWIWPVVTAGAVGCTFAALQYASGRDLFDVGGGNNQPIAPQAPITRRVYLDVSLVAENNNKSPEPLGRILVGLYGTVVPKTVRNFEALCVGSCEEPSSTTTNNPNQKELGKSKKYSFVGSSFHRIVPGFCIQGGDITHHNGMGGYSPLYGKSFPDENFDLVHGRGVLSMANSGPNSNSSQFFIALDRVRHLDGKHVVFGVILDGWNVVRKIEAHGSSSRGTPKAQIMITRVGWLLDDDDANTASNGGKAQAS